MIDCVGNKLEAGDRVVGVVTGIKELREGTVVTVTAKGAIVQFDQPIHRRGFQSNEPLFRHSMYIHKSAYIP